MRKEYVSDVVVLHAKFVFPNERLLQWNRMHARALARARENSIEDTHSLE